MFNIYLVNKTKSSQIKNFQLKDEGFNISDADWCKILSFRLKLQKNHLSLLAIFKDPFQTDSHKSLFGKIEINRLQIMHFL